MKAILTYHSIDSSGSPISVDESSFHTHVSWLAAGHCRVVPLETLIRLPEDDAAVALTFDDGFQNFADVAWPMLRAHGLPATVFVVSDHVGRDNAWPSAKGSSIPILPLMTWETLGRIAAEGVTIGSHTRTHANLRMLPSEMLDEEIGGAAQDIRACMGVDPTTFAYPFGAHNRAAAAAARVSHSYACTTELRTLRTGDDPFRLPRLDAYYFRRPGLLESWGTGAFRRYVWLRSSGRLVRRALEMTGAL